MKALPHALRSRSPSPRRVRSICAMLVGALVLSACRIASAPHDVDTVVLVSIDSLRADHVGALGYDRPTTPSIDALAAHGVVFTRAYSTTSWTLPAHVSMLTGLEAETHGVVDSESAIPAAIRTIAERAQDAGVETAGVYSGPFLQPAYGFDRGFRTYANCSGIGTDDQGAGRDWIERPENHRLSHTAVTNPCVRRQVAAWAKAAPKSGKRFLFVHLWDVHHEYAPPAGYVEIFDPDYDGSTDFSNLLDPSIGPGMSERDLRHLLALYDGEIRWTDDTIAGILADLDAAGLLRRSVVVVTSDHGDEFFEHGGKGHKLTLYDEVLRIPLVVAWPGGPLVARRSDEVVSLVDVAPAVCRWLGLPCADLGGPGGLADAARPTSNRGRDDALAHLSFVRGGPAGRARVARHTKVVEKPDGAVEFFGPPAYPLSDRVPTEAADRAGLRRSSAVVADSVRAMDARAARAREQAPFAAAPEARPTAVIDDATRERLESLGYLPTGRGEPQHGLAQGAPG